MNKTAGDFIIPLLDILQSIPILGFFPFAVIFIVPIFGLGAASMVLLFISMSWSIVFGVIAGVKSIPPHIHDMARIFGLRGWEYIKHIVFPSVYPSLIAGSILAFGSGWYFLIASEYITYGTTVYMLPGLGYYLNIASFKHANIWMSLAGLLTIALIVYCFHMFVWKKLDNNSREAKFFHLHFGYEKGVDFTPFLKTHPHHRVHFNRRHAHQWFFNLFTFSPGTYFMILFFCVAIGSGILLFKNEQLFYTPQEIFALLAGSFARILLAYILAIIIAIAIGYVLMKKPRTKNYILPIIDVLQSIPALAYFPLLYLVLAIFFSEFMSLSFASVLLLLTGMLWYLLFNVAEAVEHLPNDINDITAVYNIKGESYLKDVLIPAMFPALVTGSILAFGGGWNAIMVSEYINIGGTIHSIAGIGAAMNTIAGMNESASTLLVILFCMTMIVLFMNHFVWRKLLNRASRYVLEDE